MVDSEKTKIITIRTDNTDNHEQSYQTYADIEITDKKYKNSVLFNQTAKVPHIKKSITPQIEVVKNNVSDARSLKGIKHINPQYKFVPKFYINELKHYNFIVFLWSILFLFCIGIETWLMIEIIKDEYVNNWVCLLLLPGLFLTLSILIFYLNKWLNFRSEAKTVDFSKEKKVTINVCRLYKRLKTAYININWMCLLTYTISLLSILFIYIIAWGINKCQKWGDLSFATMHTNAYWIALVIAIAAIFTALILHLYLLLSNYIRAARIDNFYTFQIISDDDLLALKKQKNHRDFIIFFVIVMVFVLLIMFIYKYFKNKKISNNIVINN